MVSIVQPIHDLILCTSAFILTSKATIKIELDPDAFEKLKVVRGDFMKALEDIKPVCGSKTLVKLFSVILLHKMISFYSSFC